MSDYLEYIRIPATVYEDEFDPDTTLNYVVRKSLDCPWELLRYSDGVETHLGEFDSYSGALWEANDDCEEQGGDPTAILTELA